MNRIVRVHRSEDVQADLKTALDIVAELDPPDDLRVPVFQFVAQLVTQRVLEQGNVHPVLPPMQVPRTRGH